MNPKEYRFIAEGFGKSALMAYEVSEAMIQLAKATGAVVGYVHDSFFVDVNNRPFTSRMSTWHLRDINVRRFGPRVKNFLDAGGSPEDERIQRILERFGTHRTKKYLLESPMLAALETKTK